MTNEEFSNAFDTLLNSYNNKVQFGDTSSRGDVNLDEYEKSLFLTQAQDAILKEYFGMEGRTISIDDASRRQMDFSNLIEVSKINLKGNTVADATGIDYRSIFIKVPGGIPDKSKQVLFILNESLTVAGTVAGSPKKQYQILPLSYTEYTRLMSRAYQYPLKRQCWRLINKTDTGTEYTKTVELILNSAIPHGSDTELNAIDYKIRYVRRPKPIILEGVTEANLQLEGYTEETECELDPIIHQDILNKAFQLAIVSKSAATQGTKYKTQQQPTNEQ